MHAPFDGVDRCQFQQTLAPARIAQSPCSSSIWSARGTTICVPINVQTAKRRRNSCRYRKRQTFGELLKRNRDADEYASVGGLFDPSRTIILIRAIRPDQRGLSREQRNALRLASFPPRRRQRDGEFQGTASRICDLVKHANLRNR